ncbi:MAG: class I SAM-dependent methyltransferase [Candidatus Falkowbacteria bacterium]|nr:class I SAM-dependent methyltransferase [Candidatus Falkowbacteria bacterium]
MTNISNSNSLLDVNLIIEKAKVKESSKVADMGCGMHGYFSFPIAKIIGKHGHIYAIDVLKNALENIQKIAAQDNVSNIKTVWSNLEVFKGTDIASSSLDACLMINILHQSQKRVDIIREATRLLKKDGYLTIIEWSAIAAPLGPASANKVKADSLKKALDKLGYQLEEEFKPGPYHYGIRFRKL